MVLINSLVAEDMSIDIEAITVILSISKFTNSVVARKSGVCIHMLIRDGVCMLVR